MNRADLFQAIRPFAPDGRYTAAHVAAIDALADSFGLAAVSASGGNHLLKNPASFYASLKSSFGALSQPQVDGFGVLITAMQDWPLYDAAYGLATAWHETAFTMQPVKEAFWLDEAWRKKNLRYYPWYGRGYVQCTWQANYERADKELHLGGSLISNPDRMLEPKVAADTMVRGMVEGWFTGVKNSDFTIRDYVKRRRMINGTDKAAAIAEVAAKMEAALTAGGW